MLQRNDAHIERNYLNIYYGIEAIEKIKKGTVITIGSFDGVHNGHVKLFGTIRKIADEGNTSSMVITFDPHPRSIVSDKKDNFLLTTIDEKIGLIESTGYIDELLVLKFDKSFSQLTPEEFINTIVLDMIKPSHIVVGYDAHFGKDRMGDITFLRNAVARKTVKIDVVEPQLHDTEPVSSSQIRNLIRFGKIKDANHILGYQYFHKGFVVKGEGRGAVLGFPTANIECHDSEKLLPQQGVYIVKVFFKGKPYRGVMNIGSRPTFNEGVYTMEVHLQDFNDNLYGEVLKVHFIDRLRDEVKFGSKDELIEQLNKDIEELKKYKEDLWH